MKSLFLSALLLTPVLAIAQTTTTTTTTSTPTESTPAAKAAPPTTAEIKQFEIIDGTSEIAGAPDPMTAQAREKWEKACGVWEKDLKQLNPGQQLLALSCSSPTCSYQENGSYICTSTATYKLKIDGVKAPPPPAPKESSREVVVKVEPPPVIAEYTPPPMPGFVWVSGYWGWQGNRHYWYPGHWMAERPGLIWHNHSWVRRGHGWYFESGRWDRRH